LPVKSTPDDVVSAQKAAKDWILVFLVWVQVTQKNRPSQSKRLFIIVYPTIKKSTLLFALPQGYSAVMLFFSPETVNSVLITHLPINDSSQVPASFATMAVSRFTTVSAYLSTRKPET
jgi:hypothetical protein